MAVVHLHDGSQVLRDYADLARPVSSCTFSRAYVLQLIDARHVVVTGDRSNLYAVVDLPEVRYHWFQLPDSVPYFVGVAPGLDEVAWLSPDLEANVDHLHLTTAGGDRVVGVPLPNPHGGRCGGPEDSKPGAYTRSGKVVAVLDQPINSLMVQEGDQTLFRLIPDQGQWAPGTAWPAQPVWSPAAEALYYRVGDNVFRWTRSQGAVVFLGGVNWSYPTISPDGRYLAYALQRPDHIHDVYLVDLTRGATSASLIGASRSQPVFLNPSQLWFKSESQGPCGPGGDLPLIYDLRDRTESPSVIDGPVAVWPATSPKF